MNTPLHFLVQPVLVFKKRTLTSPLQGFKQKVASKIGMPLSATDGERLKESQKGTDVIVLVNGEKKVCEFCH